MLNAAARDPDPEVSDGPALVFANFEYMKKMVETAKRIDDQGRAAPMVAWNESGAPEDWAGAEEWQTGAQEEWPSQEPS